MLPAGVRSLYELDCLRSVIGWHATAKLSDELLYLVQDFLALRRGESGNPHGPTAEYPVEVRQAKPLSACQPIPHLIGGGGSLRSDLHVRIP
ncbi:hypothetical protein ACIG56_30075 [Nocardia fusca]|uniref:hypothetical protein n=1 Tax=Nocardia fusca TaxID=941183 RepID=UPI0037C628E3